MDHASLPDDLDPELLGELAEEHGTPLYVTSAETVRRRYSEVASAFPDARVQYAAKANTNPRILELLREEGAALDAVSLGEIVAAERAGYPPDRIMYTGVNPPEGEIDSVLKRDVTVNADSFSGLERVADAEHGGEGTEVGVRVNPDVGAGHHEHVVTGGEGSKFGVPGDRAVEAYERALELGLEPVGVHMHIGSGILEPEPLVEAVESLVSIAHSVEELGVDLDYVDVGGGFGVPYEPDDERLDLESLSRGIEDVYDIDATLVVEPGRYLVAESTVLLTRVNTVKHRPGNDFVGVDAGMNTLLRPAMYDAYHPITNLSRSEPEEDVDVVGPICESGDYLAHDRTLSKPEEGDLLAVHNAGAYGYVMASRYNSRPLPGEVLVDDASELVREPEGFDDLFRNARFD